MNSEVWSLVAVHYEKLGSAKCGHFASVHKDVDEARTRKKNKQAQGRMIKSSIKRNLFSVYLTFHFDHSDQGMFR